MPSLIPINNVTLEPLEHSQQRVVTFQQVADVHGVAVETVQKSFQRHTPRFTEGKHYYRLDYVAASQLGLSVQVSTNGLTVFTEKGYLLLVKPMRDEMAWKVQESMIDEYFALREAAQTLPTTTWDMVLQIAELGRQQEQRILALEAQRQADLEARLADQQRTIEALTKADQANAKADTALDTQRRFTVAEYIAFEHLGAKVPVSAFAALSRHLAQYCHDHNLPFRRVPVAGKPWPEEYEFHLSVYDAAFPGWVKRRYSQIRLLEGGA